MLTKMKAMVSVLRRGHSSRIKSTDTNFKTPDQSKLLTEQRTESNEEDVTTVWLNRTKNDNDEKIFIGSTRSINDYIQVRKNFNVFLFESNFCRFSMMNLKQ